MLNFGFPKDHLFRSQQWRHEHIVDRLGRLNIVLIDGDHNGDDDDDGGVNDDNVNDDNDDDNGHSDYDFSNNCNNDNATLSSCWRVRGRERR